LLGRPEKFPEVGVVNIVRVSPDGLKVASSVYTTGKETAGVWIHDLATDSSTRLVFTEAYYGSVAWSPDGSQIAFSSSKTGPFNTAVNGTGEEKALHPSSDDEPVAAQQQTVFRLMGTRA
jgi:Tol biopolymer transport system component